MSCSPVIARLRDIFEEKLVLDASWYECIKTKLCTSLAIILLAKAFSHYVMLELLLFLLNACARGDDDSLSV